MSYKSGFVTIIGRPNVGKSTLTNDILGEKIAIMSDKPQTTRNKIQAFYNTDDSQIIFIDTPGIHKPKNKLGDYMVTAATDTLNEVDVVIYMVDESKVIGPGDKFILESLKKVKTPVILVINKIDLLGPDDYKKLFDRYSQYEFLNFVMGVSATQKMNVDALLNRITDLLPEGPMLYPDDMITDQPERVIVAEIIREKILHFIDDEIPHGVAVEIERMKKRNGKDLIDISASIVCEKKSHKGIIIGKGGRKLKGIGKSAREDIESLLGSRVFLELFVKVREGWRDDDNMLKGFGYKK